MSNDIGFTAIVVIVTRIVLLVTPFVVLAGLTFQCTIDGDQRTDSTHDADCTEKNCYTNSDDDRGLPCSGIHTGLIVIMSIDTGFALMEWMVIPCYPLHNGGKYTCNSSEAIWAAFVWYLVEIGSGWAYIVIMPAIAKYDNEATRRRAARATFIVLILLYLARYILIIFGSLFLCGINSVGKCLQQVRHKTTTCGNSPVEENETPLSIIQIHDHIDLLLGELQGNYLIELYSSNEYWNSVCTLIKETWLYNDHCGRDAPGLTHNKIEVKRVFMVTNSGLMEAYETNAREVASVTDTADGALSNMLTLHAKQLRYQLSTIAASRNIHPFSLSHREKLQRGEVFLFHGTKIDNVDGIVRNGFDTNKCVRDPYGKGIYLTDSSQKADQYSDNPEQRVNSNLAMFIVRTRLGQCREYPIAADDGAPVDTILAGQANRFREYIATNASNLYPEFLVIYGRM